MENLGRFRYLEAVPRESKSASTVSARRAQRERGTLVLIHGFPLGASMWEPQLGLAELGWRVLVPELRGFEGTTAAVVATSMDDFAGDLIDLLDALRIDNAVIGGLSMGGYVAFAMVRHAPRYVRALILADTRAEADSPQGVEGRRKMLQRLQADGPPAVADDLLPKLVCAATRSQRPEVVDRLRRLILSNSRESIAGAITALMTRPDSTLTLSAIHCPTLILVGAEDELTPPALSEDMQRRIAGSELVAIPDAGHMSNMEQPNAFNSAVTHFLENRV
jgi:pimeloyl-ACP methyl ester carboxylesterase